MMLARSARITLLGWLFIATMVASCVPSANRPTAEPSSSAPPVWPEPPARPRVRFVNTVAHPADLGVKPSFWQRVGQIIAGREEEGLIRPTAVAADGEIIYVADAGAQALWVLDAARGRFRKIQKAKEQPLVSPVAVAVGPAGRFYMADSFLAKIFVYDAELNLTVTIADPSWRRPAGLAFDAARGRLYVADSGAHRVWIHDRDGKSVGAIGQRGPADGEFNFPTHVAVDTAGTIYVTDSLGFRIQVFDAEGRFVSKFGRHGDSSGDFAMPKGVALDGAGHVYVVDALFDAVQIFDRGGRFLLAFGERGLGPGKFWLPSGVFIGPGDRIYVADSYNQRIQIFQYVGGGDDD
jgi:DNA-binding beta-propeller fold protein YncE